MEKHLLAVPGLVPAQVNQVRQTGPLEIALEVFAAGAGRGTWLLSAHPIGARFMRSFRPLATHPHPAPLLLWLRSRLGAGRVVGVSVTGGQLIDIELAGGADTFHLVLELNGKDSRLLLLDASAIPLAGLAPPGVKLPAPEVPYQPPAQWHRYPHNDLARLPAADEAEARRMESAWQAHLGEQTFQERRTQALRRIKGQSVRLRRRLEHIEADRAGVRDADALRQEGELLQIHRHRLRPGMSGIVLPNDFASDRHAVTVTLDPALSVADNIARRFEQYRKRRDAAEHVERRFAETAAELAELARVQALLDGAQDPGAFDGALASLTAKRRDGLLPPDGPAKRAQRPENSGVMTRISSDGLTIYVGRSKTENDEVTFRIGRGRDWWLHALGVPGAHVLVRNPADGPLPPRTVREAAWLAAYYSKGRQQGGLEVTCTQRKHVRKVKGGEPGQVTHAQGRTLWVDLNDPEARVVLAGVEPSEAAE